MSHFTCMVAVRADSREAVMDKLDAILEPFDENLEVPHEKWVSLDDVARIIGFYKAHSDEDFGRQALADEPGADAPLEELTRWQSRLVASYHTDNPDNARVHPETRELGYLSTYNPLSKWDWWVLGGRWRGYLQLKQGVGVGALPQPDWRVAMGQTDHAEAQVGLDNGTQAALLGNAGVFEDTDQNFTGRADLARKRDVDFETMRDLARAEAELSYDKFEAATAGLQPPKRWDEVREEIGDIDAARRVWGANPWVQALRREHLDPWGDDTHEYWCVGQGREAFVEKAARNAIPTFAFIDLDGNWSERGHMGWFGIASDEKDGEDWGRDFASWLDSLDDDVWLAVLDLHI